MTTATQLTLDADIGKAIELLQKLQTTGEIGQVRAVRVLVERSASSRVST